MRRAGKGALVLRAAFWAMRIGLPKGWRRCCRIGAGVVRHDRAITFQLAEVVVTGPMVRAILAAIGRLRATPS